LAARLDEGYPELARIFGETTDIDGDDHRAALISDSVAVAHPKG
jgi:hypothetical protein